MGLAGGVRTNSKFIKRMRTFAIKEIASDENDIIENAKSCLRALDERLKIEKRE